MKQYSVIFIVFLIVAACSRALADTQGQVRTSEGMQRSRIAANEGHLWLIVESSRQTSLYHREAGGRFDLGRTTSGNIVTQTAVGADLLAFFSDGSLYRYVADEPRPIVESVLPGRTIPSSLACIGRIVYAIVPSGTARELPILGESAADQEAPSKAFEPGESAWSIAAYDGSRWYSTAALPESIPAKINQGQFSLQLYTLNDKLMLFAPGADREHIQYFRFESKHREWEASAPVRLSDISAYWATTLSRTPVLAETRRDSQGAAHLSVYRLEQESDKASGIEWKPVKIQLSSLPDGVEAAEYGEVVGFNQHLSILTRDKRGGEHLVFGLATGAPAEPTLSISTLLDERGLTQRSQKVVQIVTFIILLSVLTGLFVFRHGSMVRAVDLPPNTELALMIQRMLAFTIDFAPFVLTFGHVMQLSAYDGLKTLLHWGVAPESNVTPLGSPILIWWCLSTASYTCYCLFMEIAVRRTFGKMIARVYIVTENGVMPSCGQLLVRNATRLVECMPQFWVFAALVLLSRNRQRLGDIFARTIIVRATGLIQVPRRNVQNEGEAADKRSRDEDEHDPQ